MLIDVVNIAKSYGARCLFAGVTFRVGDKARLALVGANGAGKTTLLRIIASQENADAGELIVAKNTRIGFLEQDVSANLEGKGLLEMVLAAQPELVSLAQRLTELESCLATINPSSPSANTTAEKTTLASSNTEIKNESLPSPLPNLSSLLAE